MKNSISMTSTIQLLLSLIHSGYKTALWRNGSFSTMNLDLNIRSEHPACICMVFIFRSDNDLSQTSFTECVWDFRGKGR